MLQLYDALNTAVFYECPGKEELHGLVVCYFSEFYSSGRLLKSFLDAPVWKVDKPEFSGITHMISCKHSCDFLGTQIYGVEWFRNYESAQYPLDPWTPKLLGGSSDQWFIMGTPVRRCLLPSSRLYNIVQLSLLQALYESIEHQTDAALGTLEMQNEMMCTLKPLFCKEIFKSDSKQIFAFQQLQRNQVRIL